MDTVHVRVPASTSNLGPGFDCVGLALSLYDEVAVEVWDGGGVDVQLMGPEASRVRGGMDSLVVRGIRRLWDMLGRPLSGVRITQVHRIPVARGLGSSGAAVLAGLAAANRLTGDRLSSDELLDLAFQLEGHPDNVTPALVGGLVVASGQDGHVEYVQLNVPSPLNVVVAVPDFELSTCSARQVLPDAVPFRDAVENVGYVALLVAALAAGEWKRLRRATEDRLHQPYREHLIPGMREVFRAALDAGALGTVISGAGSSLLALACGGELDIGKAMEEAWRASGVHSKVLILDICRDGLHIEKISDGGLQVSSTCEL